MIDYGIVLGAQFQQHRKALSQESIAGLTTKAKKRRTKMLTALAAPLWMRKQMPNQTHFPREGNQPG
jgi:hypothetical protein